MWKRGAVAAVVLSVLTACGGSGSPSAPSNPPAVENSAAAPANGGLPPPPAPAVPPGSSPSTDGINRVIAGQVGVNILPYANVSAARVENGRITSELAQGWSTSNGDYRITTSGYTGLVVVQASGGLSRDLATNVPTPLVSPLRSVRGLSGLELRLNVTPLTEAAVIVAGQANGGLTESTVADAQKEIQAWLGFDPHTAPMRDGHDPDIQNADRLTKAHMVYLGAISQHVADNAGATPASLARELGNWLQAGSGESAPMWFVQAVNDYGWNPNNRTGIHNWPSLRNVIGNLNPIAPSGGSITTGSGQDITRDGFTLTLVHKDASMPQAIVDRLVASFFDSYPRMVARFNPAAPRTIRLVIDPAPAWPEYAGYAQGTEVTLKSQFIKANPFDLDLMVHEVFHIVQGYPPGSATPQWVVEGLASYAASQYGSWSVVAGVNSLPLPTPAQSYMEGYGVSARFLRWLEVRMARGIVDRLNDALLRGTFTDAFWVQHTGLDLNMLWEFYVRSPSIP